MLHRRHGFHLCAEVFAVISHSIIKKKEAYTPSFGGHRISSQQEFDTWKKNMGFVEGNLVKYAQQSTPSLSGLHLVLSIHDNFTSAGWTGHSGYPNAFRMLGMYQFVTNPEKPHQPWDRWDNGINMVNLTPEEAKEILHGYDYLPHSVKAWCEAHGIPFKGINRAE